MRSLTRAAVIVLATAAMAFAAAPKKATCAQARETFANRCEMCHGPNGKGYAAIHTPDFTSKAWQARHTDAQLIHAVENGVNGAGQMPAFKGQLSDAQIDALVKCVVRGFGEPAAAKPAH